MRQRARMLGADLTWLAGRVLMGVGSAALLCLAVAGALLVGAVAAVAVYLAPIVAAGCAAVLVVSVLLRPYSPTVRRWLARRPLRSTAWAVSRATGRTVAAAVVWWLLACRAVARTERARTAAHRGADIPMAYRPLPDGHVAMLRGLLADRATWRDLAYLVAAPVYAVGALVLVSLLWAAGIALLVEAPSATPSQRWWTDPLPWLMVATAAGAVGASPFAVHGLARGGTALGGALLSAGEGALMRAELAEQRLRRQLAVDAAERERRRIERDLHDGAQQRLVALGMSLGLAREKLPTDPLAAAALVDEAHAEAKLALAELRDLARGIHPAILGDRGLDAALSDLVRRTPIPVSIILSLPRRPPPVVESAAYFVVSEALTNVARHAAATRATVRIAEQDGLLDVAVSDDGMGGADPAVGTGLAGLSDRVGALGGRLTVTSPPGGPTTIRAELPCAS